MHHDRRLATLRCACLLLPLVLAAPARAADAGEFEIVGAWYGTAQRNEEVTSRLKELARSDRQFRAGNDTLGGDPAPGEVKVLRIFAKDRAGRLRTFEYPENTVVDGSRFIGWGEGAAGGASRPGRGYGGGWNGGGPVHTPGGGRDTDSGDFQILRALYGTAARHADVTDRLRELARQDRGFRAANDVFGGDPAYGEVKVLRIVARTRDGCLRTFEYTENDRVDGALYTGWRAGQFGEAAAQTGWGEVPLPSSNQNGYARNRGTGRLAIVHASWGADARQRDVTYRVRSRVAADRLDVRADNTLAGIDPARGTVKTLWVTYRIDGGPEQRARVAENDRLRLP